MYYLNKPHALLKKSVTKVAHSWSLLWVYHHIVGCKMMALYQFRVKLFSCNIQENIASHLGFSLFVYFIIIIILTNKFKPLSLVDDCNYWIIWHHNLFILVWGQFKKIFRPNRVLLFVCLFFFFFLINKKWVVGDYLSWRLP